MIQGKDLSVNKTRDTVRLGRHRDPLDRERAPFLSQIEGLIQSTRLRLLLHKDKVILVQQLQKETITV